MKIDVESIDYNAIRLITDAVQEFEDSGALAETAAAEMEFIRGVLEMANAMREVIRA